MANVGQSPYVEIIEQPSPKALRFRYECEGRMAGSLPGATSTAENKTYPAIKVHNYKGEAVVVVSCVTRDKPYKPHPHSLVGKEGCNKGVCTIRFNNDSMTCTFPNLGIQCIKKKGIDEALRVRESLRVDPFNTGFSHKTKDIDLNVVRLCFQVFIEGNNPGKFNRPLEALVSEPIFDKKAMCDLMISDMSHYASPCSGNQRIFLLCEKIVKDDIQIKVYDDEGWEAFAEFQHVDVWKQVAIKFNTPAYKYPDRNAVVHIQLVRPSDGAMSEPRQFHYFAVPGTPLDLTAVQLSYIDDDIDDDIHSDSESSPDTSEADSVVNVNQFSNPIYEAIEILYVDTSVQCLLLDDKYKLELNRYEKQIKPSIGNMANLNEPYNDRMSFVSSLIDNRESYLSEDLNDVLSMAGSLHSELGGSLCGSTLTLNNRLSLAGRSDATFDDRPSSVLSITDEVPKLECFSGSELSLNQRLSLAGRSDATFSGSDSQRCSLVSDRSDFPLRPTDSMASLNNQLSNASSTRESFMSDSFSEPRLSSVLSEKSLNARLTLIDASDSVEESDMLEKHIACLESMKLEDFDDAKTYSSYQMAMKDPMLASYDEENDIYDNPFDGAPPLPPKPMKEQPVAPPRTTSFHVGERTPPLPPRKFKRMNQPLPQPPPDAFKSALFKAQGALKRALQRKGMGSKACSKTSLVSKKASVDSQGGRDCSPINAFEVSGSSPLAKAILDFDEMQSSPCPVPLELAAGSRGLPDLATHPELGKETGSPDSLPFPKVEAESIYGLVEVIKNRNPQFPSELFDDLNDLTEAENYALYTTLAPLATMSECDDGETMSMLYQEIMAVRNQAMRQVEGEKETPCPSVLDLYV